MAGAADRLSPRPSLLTALGATFAPLRIVRFRWLWVGAVFANFSQQMLTASAAWLMFELTRAPDQVALVQTVAAIPVTLLALPAGSLADIHDKRKVAMLALVIALFGSLILALAALAGSVRPPMILLCVLLAGIGNALFFPSWQSSMREILGLPMLSAGVALNATAANLSRSLGASAGGVLVLFMGMAFCFAVNAALYAPMLIALLLWRRETAAPTHRRESMARATFAGLRYAALSHSARLVLIRAFISAVGTSAIYALLPFAADRLQGAGATGFGFLLGAFGLGAVASGLLAGLLRGRLHPEASVGFYSALQGAAILVLMMSQSFWLSAAATFLCGACWVTNTAVYNVSIQMRAPAWVGGRMISLFFAAVAAGLGAGSWLWGHLAAATTVDTAFIVAAGLLLATPLFGRLAPLGAYHAAEDLRESPRPPLADQPEGDGAVLIEARYAIQPADEQAFLALMARIGRVRERNGGFGFQVYRDLSREGIWVEHCRYPDWSDYLRARDRMTVAERKLHDAVLALHQGEKPAPIRRLLASGPAAP